MDWAALCHTSFIGRFKIDLNLGAKAGRLIKKKRESLFSCCLPSRMLFQFVEYGQIAIFKDQVEFLLATKHFNQIDQVGMFQLLPLPTVTILTEY